MYRYEMRLPHRQVKGLVYGATCNGGIVVESNTSIRGDVECTSLANQLTESIS